MASERRTQMDQAQLTALYEVSSKLNSQLALDPLLIEIMDRAIELLDADKGLLLLGAGPGGEGAQVRVARAQGGVPLEQEPAVSGTVIRKVLGSGESVLLRLPGTQGGSTTDSIASHGLQSIVCAPLSVKGEPMGAIYLDTTRAERPFDDSDLAFLEAFANLSAVAVANAKAYREIEQLNAGLEEKVAQRTGELEDKNRELTDAYHQLEQAQMTLVRAEKMAALGRLVAGIAHEVNTPLGAVSGNNQTAAMALDKLEAGLPEGTRPGPLETLRKLNRADRTACDRIDVVVQGLKRFARLDEGERKVVDLHEGLDHAVSLLEPQHGARVRFVKGYGELPRYECRPADLNQVFMALLLNACEAIEGEGEVRIETRVANGAVEVVVSDDGRGIADDAIGSIFDPGYTTKGVGVGTGLGLSIGHAIVTEHGGEIRVESGPAGSRFTVRLPLP